MSSLTDKDRMNLNRVLERLEELEIYAVQREKLRRDRTLWYATERLFIKAGELMKRFRNGCDSLFRSTPIFKSLTGYRDVLAHTIDTDVEIVIGSFDSLSKLKKEIKDIIESNHSSNSKLSRYKLFGKSGTKLNRQRFIDSISDNLNLKEKDTLTISEPEDNPQVVKNISEIINNSELKKLTTQNKMIRDEVTSDIIKWSIDSQKSATENNFCQKELNEIDRIKNLSTTKFLKGYPSMNKNLINSYPELQSDLNFYNEKRLEVSRKIRLRKKQKKEFDVTNEIEAIKQNLTDILEKHIIENKIKQELDHIQKSRSSFQNKIYKKVEEYNKIKDLVSLFDGDISRLWGLSSNKWGNTDFGIIKRYAEILNNEESIRRLSSLLGKFKKSKKKLIEQELNEYEYNYEWELESSKGGEYVGITQGDDLANSIISELVYLADKDAEFLVYNKLLEKQLLTFDQKDYVKRMKETPIKKKTTSEKILKNGPIIICVDTSGSMKGIPEQVAKTIAFTLLKIALKSKRQCYLISFSTSIQTLELTNLHKDLDGLVSFLSSSFHGGTDLNIALKEALNKNLDENYVDADILMISDFVAPELNDEISELISESKENGTKFHSLTITENPNSEIFDSFDNNWIYNPNKEEDSIKNFVRNIKNI